MQISMAQRFKMLRSIALFQELDDDQLANLVQELAEFHIPSGELLYKEGDRADNLYIVFTGEFHSFNEFSKGEETFSKLSAGDVFGGRALLNGTGRVFTIRAHQDSYLLYLPKKYFFNLISDFPEIASKINQRDEAKEIKTEIDFDWLREGETIHHLMRKHSAYLWIRFSRPILSAIFGFLSINLSITHSDAQAQLRWLTLGGALIFISIVWSLWEYFDWRNDFYVITNIRVVWLEHVLLRSTSRKEAPLSTIQQVNVHTSLMGRILHFGDVIVRTYTGTVLMPAVGKPLHVKEMIEEYVARESNRSREDRHDSIRRVVRESLGKENIEEEIETKAEDEKLKMIDPGERFQLFKTRHVDGDVITYHRHWFVLFSSLLLPAFFLVAVIYALNTLYSGLPTEPSAWLIAITFTLIPILVMLYRLLDWRNDIYRLTSENLIDSEKKPLGSEITKSASLANVLSLENHRVGILGLILNFGEVRINIGDTSLAFVDVHDPALIQNDIFIRMQALKHSREIVHDEEERARMAEWLKVYEEERQQDPDTDG